MKLFRDYELRSVLTEHLNKAYGKIDSLTNEEIMANNLDILADNFFEEFYIEHIEIGEEDFSKRSIEQGKIKRYLDPFFAEVTRGSYVYEDGIIAVFYYPYTGDKTLFRCQASTYSLSGYPDIDLDECNISIRTEQYLREFKGQESVDELLKKVNSELENIKRGVGYINADVNTFNRGLRFKIEQKLKEKKDKVNAFYDISKMFEVPIEKKEYAISHIPLRRRITPISHKYKKEDYYTISDASYLDILTSIKHTASTYERTPNSYRSMQEEDLRNTLLAALNATYEGDATGETFRNNGKTDICIEQKNRAAFVAECKMWTGKGAVGAAVKQLDSYLTWRDCKTALIYFVRRKDFIKIIDSVETALKAIENMKTVYKIDRNEFDCTFISIENPGQQIRIRVMLFNLYCAEKQ